MIDIEWLKENGPCKKFSVGADIPCPGGKDSSPPAMYILLSGSVDAHKRGVMSAMQKVASLIKGDVFGGREYFAGADDYGYIATEDSLVYVITEESFSDLSWARPDILFEILRAAYLPLRKPLPTTKSAAQTEAVKKPAEEAKKPAAEAAKPAQPEKKQAAAQAGQAAPTAAPKTAPAQAPTAAPTAAQNKPKAPAAMAAPVVPASNGIFPQGHKHYPDVAKPENTKLVFPKEYNCPFCKKAFNDFRVFRSKLYESDPMRYDLRKFYTDFVTEWYDILTCQSCYFSTFHNYFTDPKPIQKAKIENNLIAVRAEIHMDFTAERDINYVFTTHYLAILCSAAYPTMGKQLRAKLWGNLSWLYEDAKDEEMEKFAAKQAAEAYEQVYTESRLTPVQEQITCLSIAGMQSRAGIDNNLKKFLFTAKTQKMGDKQYAKLAEDFMYELKMEDE